MARTVVVPPGPTRGGRGKGLPIPPPGPVKGKGKKGSGKPLVPLPTAARGRGAPRGAPLPSPPPRIRTTSGMPGPSQVPVQRGPAPTPPTERLERLGPAMSAGAGSSPKRRAVAQAMRGGRMAF